MDPNHPQIVVDDDPTDDEVDEFMIRQARKAIRRMRARKTKLREDERLDDERGNRP